jgi:hypothetical protein
MTSSANSLPAFRISLGASRDPDLLWRGEGSVAHLALADRTDSVAPTDYEAGGVVLPTSAGQEVLPVVMMWTIVDADVAEAGRDAVGVADLEAEAGSFAATGTGSTIPRSMVESSRRVRD